MSIAKQKEGIIRERDRLTTEVEELNKRLQQQKTQNDTVDKKRIEFETKCKDLYKLLDVSAFFLLPCAFHYDCLCEQIILLQETSSEAFKEKRLLDQIKIILNEVTAERNGLTEQVKHYKDHVRLLGVSKKKKNAIIKVIWSFSTQCEALQTNNVQLNLKIGAVKANLLKMTTQYNVCNGKLNKIQSDVDDYSSECDKLQIELNQKINLIKLKDTENNRLLKENTQLLKFRDVIQKRVILIDAERAELTKEVLKLK